MRQLIAISLLFLLTSCSKEKTIYFKAKNADGLIETSNISLHGVEIGKIEKITITNQGDILIKSTINPDIDFPIDTEFTITESGIISPKIINVSLGKSKKMISETDTISLKLETKDSLKSDIKKLVNKISETDKNDSILKELKRLNENLEKQQKTK